MSDCRKITVCDCTLSDMCGREDCHMLFREKLSVAEYISRYGADIIELPAVRRAKEDSVVFRTIAGAVGKTAVSIRCGSGRNGIDMAAECLGTIEKKRAVISLPVSTASMEYSFRMKETAMLEKISELCRYASERFMEVEFEMLDALAADGDYVLSAAETAVAAGARIITVSDNSGTALPSDFERIILSIKKIPGISVYVMTFDNISAAVLNAAASLKAGADGVKVSSGNSMIMHPAAFASFIREKGGFFGVSSGLKHTEIISDSTRIAEINVNSGKAKPEIGSHGKNDDIFLPFGSSEEDIRKAAEKLGYDLSEKDCGKVYESFVDLSSRKGTIEKKEFEAIIAADAMQAPPVFRLVSYVITASSNANSVSCVILEKNGERLSGTASGDGPIDSAFRAIENCIGCRYELDDFQIQAVTEGREALGSALVRLRSGGRLYSGSGLSSDICGASVKAYINALNRITSAGD